MKHMRAFWKLAFVKAKLYLRDPMSMFFTLLFGPLMLLMIGLIFGNSPNPLYDGRGQVDVSMPAYMAMIIGVVGLTAVPINFTIQRETGQLRRFRITPLRPLAYFVADALIPFVMILVGILLMILVGKIAFAVQVEGYLPSIIAGIFLGEFAFICLGYILAGIVPSIRVAIAAGNVIVYPMVLLSGAFIPLEVMPKAVSTVSRFIPLTYVATLLKGLWFGEGWSGYLIDVAVLAGIVVVGAFIVTRTFRWE
jgi:ABC-2 type transport system permease protein